jgi:hypothetical protein
MNQSDGDRSYADALDVREELKSHGIDAVRLDEDRLGNGSIAPSGCSTEKSPMKPPRSTSPTSRYAEITLSMTHNADGDAGTAVFS